MSDHFQAIYQSSEKAALYERMVSREDQRGNLFTALLDIRPPYGLDVVEFGAGTGRLTRLLSVMVRQIHAFDMALPMLRQAADSLSITGMTGWTLTAADNRAMPIAANSADIVIEGWSFGHGQSWYTDWQYHIGQMLSEMARIARPGGTLILIETLGTGNRQPQPPTPGLAALYDWWETEHGFTRSWIRTDYQFESLAEADELTRFFFGDELADRLVQQNQIILPECTGIWHKHLPET